MYGNSHKRPIAPKRNVWADLTKSTLEDVARRRQEMTALLDAEERAARERCNHVLPDGTSTMVEEEDYEYDRSHVACSVCQYR